LYWIILIKKLNEIKKQNFGLININKSKPNIKILITNNDFNFPLRNKMQANITIYTTPFVKPFNFMYNWYGQE
jgi:lipid A disaccharide synthetase